MPAEPSCPPPPLRLTLDPAALAHNWRALDRLSGTAAAGAAVKADGYGIGARRAVPVLAAAGCRDFFVAHWAEAAALVDLVDPACLAVLHGPLTAAEAAWAQANGVRPVLNSLEQIERWQAVGGGVCHLMVDTGINRLGLPLAALGDSRLAALRVDILLSHLASADEESPLNGRQLEAWQAARQRVPHRRASLANSAGITLGAAYHGQLTRPGLALYGGVPCAALAGQIRPVVRPEAAILQVRTIAAGDTVGYNATFTAPGPMRVGVVGLGYADGYLRAWSGCGSAHFDGVRLPVLGRVSMDMTVIDLTATPRAGEGDWVTIDYDLPAAAQLTGLSQYELLTSLGQRLARN
ncbi:alanine racemase [Novosphingobium piscinae]|uniref:Alanine racemase n=1 Tax=Novosphingobium piscinae TaxID=1507448 RepID=A0A7X1FYR6_9SPHN|nr:alanine racemase [Novosphingobium piscinae]MBC2669460.1 alanine racemase [Novosphingobium piscinae]